MQLGKKNKDKASAHDKNQIKITKEKEVKKFFFLAQPFHSCLGEIFFSRNELKNS